MAGRKKSSKIGSADRAPWSVVVKAVFKDAMVLDPDLSNGALRVGLRLMHYFDMDGTSQCYPSIGTLAKDLYMSEEGVRGAIKRLEREEWFSVQRTDGGRDDGQRWGVYARYRSNHYVPRWQKIQAWMPDRWAQLEQLRGGKPVALTTGEQDGTPNGGTGINANASPNAGWGIVSNDPPTPVSRNPQQPLVGTPNGRTPNLPYISSREKLPEDASRSPTVSFSKNGLHESGRKGSAANTDDELFDPDDPDLIPWRPRDRNPWPGDCGESDE